MDARNNVESVRRDGEGNTVAQPVLGTHHDEI